MEAGAGEGGHWRSAVVVMERRGGAEADGRFVELLEEAGFQGGGFLLE